MTDDEKRAYHVKIVGAAVRRFEEAWGPWEQTIGRALQECDTVRDAHPAALDYQVANEVLLQASDELVKALWDAGTSYARRGDVLYLIVENWDKEDRGRSHRIRRIDLRSTGGRGEVLYVDEETNEDDAGQE
jgi:hypothetical protein